MNYNLLMENQIEQLNGVPKLLLHTCCAPCSSATLERLSNFFEITVFYYNPNITEEEEFQRRREEQQRFISKFQPKHTISFIEGPYEPELFFEMSKGLEMEKEGGARCFKCYHLRMKATALKAKELGYDYFTTSLSISPHKNSEKLNQIGEYLAKEIGVNYLYADLKKKNGYKRSIELSKEYGLYRQYYCGCIYSKQERELEYERI